MKILITKKSSNKKMWYDSFIGYVYEIYSRPSTILKGVVFSGDYKILEEYGE